MYARYQVKKNAKNLGLAAYWTPQQEGNKIPPGTSFVSFGHSPLNFTVNISWCPAQQHYTLNSWPITSTVLQLKYNTTDMI
jgi:hypothetical protein